MSDMSDAEKRVWKYLITNKLARAGDVAMICDVHLDFAQQCIDRIGTPRDVFEKELRQGLREDEMNQRREVKPTRVQTLETAIKLTSGDRNKAYGPPYDNLSDCANLWNAYINSKLVCLVPTADGGYEVNLKAEDVAWMNVLQKTARSFNTGYHPDNYTDAAAYAAIAGECREIEG
jgi:hypothetical protein